MLRLGLCILVSALLPACIPPPPPQPNSPEVKSQSGGVPGPGDFVELDTNPEVIREVVAEYPQMAKQAGLEGKVVVWALVGTDGAVTETRIAKSSGTAGLDESAQRAVSQYRFKPATKSGRPVACWTSKMIVFELEHHK